MDRFEELLAGDVPPGLYRYSSRRRVTTIAAAAARAGWRCFHLDGRRIKDKAAFLAAAARAMDFPSYFGGNWDAFEECLNDLSWQTEGARGHKAAVHGFLLLYDDATGFAEASPQEWTTALAILKAAVAPRKGSAAPLAVLFRRGGPALASLPAL